MTRTTRIFILVFSLLQLIARADEPAMPLEIHERLWERPGPAQDGPGAPRLLIVYPRNGTGQTEADAVRYAGRVEPESATVTLAGEPLKVWPGGVFIGILPIEPGQTLDWSFVARAGDNTTTVERTVQRRAESKPTPAPRRPLTFFRAPVSPTGDYWLPGGKKLRVTLWASADTRAEVRIGPDGVWEAMTPGEADPRRGGRYAAELEPGATSGGPRLAAVEFRLRAPEGDSAEKPAFLRSALRLGRLPAAPPLGRITKNLGTFLKAPEGWERWGNWIQKTPFPVLEVRDDRMRVDFGRGESGWIETENAKIEFEQPFGKLPRLGSPTIDSATDRLVLRWTDRESPVAVVFGHAGDPTGDRLRIDMPGVDRLPDKEYELSGARPVRSLNVRAGTATAEAPWIDVALKEPLWGFGMRAAPLRIEVRTPPRLERATAERPLAGLKIMLDAGHGGSDLGSIGPSGVVEADLNLVQAAWLEKELAAMGGVVRQIRRDDRFVDLDRRVDMALAWDPDLFISLHHNSVGMGADPMADSGPKVFYHYATGIPLARAIAVKLSALWPGSEARTLPEVFRVNRNVSLCPSVLVETAFVCNPKDEVRLRKTETLKAGARAIAEAVRENLSR